MIQYRIIINPIMLHYTGVKLATPTRGSKAKMVTYFPSIATFNDESVVDDSSVLASNFLTAPKNP